MSRTASVILLTLILSMYLVTPLIPVNIASIDSPMRVSSTSAVTTARILTDESHSAWGSDNWSPGNCSEFGALLMHYNNTVHTNLDESLDSGILDNYDILFLFFPQIPYTQSEVDAIHAFVDGGGHLVMAGVSYRPSAWNFTNQYLNPVSEPYGITFNDDSHLWIARRSDGVFPEHPLLYEVDQVTTKIDGVQGCSLNADSPAEALVVNPNDLVGLAVTETSGGKVIAVPSPATFMDYRKSNTYQPDPQNHIQATINVIDWLMGNDPRIAEMPEETVITVGNGPDLLSSEVEEYDMFVGLIHDHTTYSDGRDNPSEMVIAGINAGLDFMVMTDHSWESVSNVGINGALACKALIDPYGTDMLLVVGAELSYGPHVVGFPLTENIWSGDMSEKVDAIHSQGGTAILAHPTLGQGYKEPWEHYDLYGYDAFEVINTDFMQGLGEGALYRPFVAASDGHDANYVGTTLTAIFVENPSGPNGTLAQEDIQDAVVNRRVVALQKGMKIVLGESVWVERYLEIRDEAEIALSDAADTIEQAQNDGATAGLSMAYLASASDSMQNQNPSRAIVYSEIAVSEDMLSLDLIVESLGLLEPNQDATLSLTLTNDRAASASLNVTPFLATSIHFNQASAILEAPAGGSDIFNLQGQTDEFGYTRIILNIQEVSTVNQFRPVTIMVGGLIGNLTVYGEQADSGENLILDVFTNREDYKYIATAEVTYDDGNGEATAALVNIGDRYSVSLGPFPIGTNVTYVVSFTDVLGNIYTYDEGNYILAGSGLVIDLTTLAIVGVAAIGVLAIVIVLMKIKK